VSTLVLGGRPPELQAYLTRRRACGQDRFDEVWKGTYHDFYAEHALEEVLVVDPAQRSVRIWQLRAGGYVETGSATLLSTTARTIIDTLDWP